MKKSLVFIFGIALLIGFVAANNQTNQTDVNETQETCVDSDGGLEYFTYGEIIIGNNTAPSIVDVCGGRPSQFYDSNYVYEGRCVDGGGAKAEVYLCPNGCEEGACIEELQNETEGNYTENITEFRNRTIAHPPKQYRKIIAKQNRLRVHFNETGELPEGCERTGSVVKCRLADGTRQMTIMAGKSGNTIIQVKGVNMSTKVELYQSNGSVYGTFKDNKTKLINYLPDQIREKIRERIKARIYNESFELELDEEGTYNARIKKQARLFGFIKVKEKVRAQIDPETGEFLRIKNPWWGFLAKDVVEEE